MITGQPVAKMGITAADFLCWSTLFQLEERTLLDFAENIISHQGSSIKSRLDNLHSLVVPEKGGGILGNKGVIEMFANGIKVNTRKSSLPLCYNQMNINNLKSNLGKLLGCTVKSHNNKLLKNSKKKLSLVD